MSSEIDAAGTLAAGGLVAAALDKQDAKAGDVQTICPNCGTAIVGHYCHECGQSAHLPRSIGHIFHDILHGVLHFDSKGWRTLPMLVARPGTLTRDYVEGKRARYVAPFPMFLFTVFVMYFTFAMVGGPNVNLADAVQLDPKSVEAAQQELVTETERLKTLEAKLAAARAKPVPVPGEAAELKGQITELRTEIGIMKATLGTMGVVPRDPENPDAPQPPDWREALAKAADKDMKVDTGNPGLNAKLTKALKNPELLFYKMQQSAYKFSFLLVPLSLPFVWLLFPFRRGTHLYDHAVFTLYSLSFMSLLFVFAVLLARIGLISFSNAMAISMFAPPIHIFVQLKGAYGLSIGGALARTILLSIFAIVVLALFMLVIMALGAA
ncbi:DUF3667 domain-containing protein [uncultured Sphingosinicella sp.]|mgnify:CR=1 FL=1|uniref:DUF3667 domain-containing protein n=1 Tax=uncultured Sphingosinicella sp. TaxID=478748 RepID=UPI0030DAB27C|tara:strand:- start:33001 stop:34143 length:1143 start_codon:yes stop_codon:yes gene_type:complete